MRRDLIRSMVILSSSSPADIGTEISFIMTPRRDVQSLDLSKNDCASRPIESGLVEDDRLRAIFATAEDVGSSMIIDGGRRIATAGGAMLAVAVGTRGSF